MSRKLTNVLKTSIDQESLPGLRSNMLVYYTNKYPAFFHFRGDVTKISMKAGVRCYVHSSVKLSGILSLFQHEIGVNNIWKLFNMTNNWITMLVTFKQKKKRRNANLRTVCRTTPFMKCSNISAERDRIE